MAIVSCPGCGARMSDQWPSCPACAGHGKTAGKARRKKRFNPTVHYLLSTTLTTAGALIYGAQFLGRYVSPGVMKMAIGMMLIGALWYGSARILALVRKTIW